MHLSTFVKKACLFLKILLCFFLYQEKQIHYINSITAEKKYTLRSNTFAGSSIDLHEKDIHTKINFEYNENFCNATFFAPKDFATFSTSYKDDREQRACRVYGHRGSGCSTAGAPSIFPENSFISIQHAVNQNLCGVEIDVFLTKDMVVVVGHGNGFGENSYFDQTVVNNFRKRHGGV